MEYEIDMEQAIIRAEEMLCGLSEESIKMYDFAASVSLIISTMAQEFKIDSLQMMMQVESIMVQIEESKKGE